MFERRELGDAGLTYIRERLAGDVPSPASCSPGWT